MCLFKNISFNVHFITYLETISQYNEWFTIFLPDFIILCLSLRSPVNDRTFELDFKTSLGQWKLYTMLRFYKLWLNQLIFIKLSICVSLLNCTHMDSDLDETRIQNHTLHLKSNAKLEIDIVWDFECTPTTYVCRILYSHSQRKSKLTFVRSESCVPPTLCPSSPYRAHTWSISRFWDIIF